MWQKLHREAPPEFSGIMNDLLQSTSRTIIFSMGGVYLLWHTIATVSWPVELGWQIWSVTIVVVATSLLALYLLPKYLIAAHSIWLVGVMLAILLALALFQQPQIAFLYALLPLLAVVILGRVAGLLVEVGVVIVLWSISASAIAPLPPSTALTIAIAGTVTWLAGWASAHALTTVTQWSLFSFAEAQQHLAVAQEQRAQLSVMLKDIDHAYYRLERANAALVAARKVAEEAERFRAEFVTNISHELRTPLNLIVGFSEVMMTAPQSYGNVQMPGVYRRDLNAIYRSAQHLLALVDDVLDLARIEAGKIALVREEVDLSALVTEATDTMRDYINAKGLELRLELDADLPMLWIDRVRIRQVLLNLLVNATRFTTQGHISVSISRQDDEAIVRVQDTGHGIPEHEVPKIFDAFRTTEQPTSTWHSGTGLGLPISKQFVELHHGRMGVESVAGQGTTFWFTLPRATNVLVQQLTPRSNRWTPLVRLGASERIVVVAHDDPHIATLLKRHLEGYQVVGVADPSAGAALAEELQAVALVMDECHAEMPATSGVPIVRCPLPSARQTAIALGAVDMLLKPLTREKLFSALDALGKPIRRLLVADDDPDMGRLLQRMLSARTPAPECVVAYNGVEALEILRGEAVDLVLLDLAMPQLNGRGVLDQLALEQQLADIPVIIISAQEQDYSHLRMSGAIQITRTDGFRLGEIVQTLEAVFNALSPGWSQLATTASKPAAAPAG